jgi:hypothetical protein
MKNFVLTAAIGIAVALSTTPAGAQAVPGLYNTGTDSTNAALVGGNGVTDPHYVIVTSTSPGFTNVSAVTYFNGAYTPDDANSRWVSLSADGNPGSNTTDYRLTFDLTGYDPSTAVITGLWGADNAATMSVNGVATTNVIPGPVGFNPLTPFTVNNGFVSGINFFDFFVTDFGPPTALRVDDLAFQGAPVDRAVPEPSTWTMMLLGFAFAGYSIRRRRRTTAITASI